MAYSKTTWNNISDPPINAENLNKIEQGIYNNSLGIDKINPSGTATTTAEIEEGQISDVIGLKSLKLKGQTSQYTTTGKNKLSLTIENKTTGGITLTRNNDNSYKISGTSTSLLLFNSSNTQILTANTTYTLGITNGNNNVQLSLRTPDGSSQYVKTEGTATYATFTPTTDIEVSLYIRIPSGATVNETIFPIVVEGSTIGTYEPYTGSKASPNPDFPQDVNNVSGDNIVRISNKNLYDKDDSNLIMNNVYINATGFVLTSSNNMKTICMPCRANTTYTVSKTLSSRFIIGTASSNTIGTSMTAGRTNPSGTQVSVTSGANDKYLFVFYYHGSADTKTEQEIRNSIQVEIGSTATTYTAHQGNNFEINLGIENVFDYTKSAFSTNKAEVRLIDNGFIAEVVTTTTSQDLFFRTQINDNLLVDGETYTISYEAIKGIRKPLQLQLRNRDGSYASKAMATSVTYDSNYGLFVVNNIFNETNSATVEAGTIAIVKNIQVERGTKIHAFTPYGTTPIYLGKIGTHCNDIRKYNGKWYWHKEIGSQTFNGSETWTAVTTNVTGKYRPQINLSNIVSANLVKPSSNANVGLILCDYYKPVVAGSAGTYGANEGISLDVSGYVQTYNDDYNTNDISLYKTWLASNNITIYWVYATPEDEEITYTPLIRQLDEIYNSGLYDETNISQDNSSEAFILDIEACKNNINGIVEYIRR